MKHEYRVHFTLRSENRKVGPIPVSMTEASSCPPSCPLKKNGCYAESSFLAIHWRKLSTGKLPTAISWTAFCDAIKSLNGNGILYRVNQAGDLPGHGEHIDTLALSQLVAANAKGKHKGFTYTHKHGTAANLTAIREANDKGFTVNLSANSLEHADKLAETGAGPVVCVLPSFQNTNTVTPGGRKVVVCPATQREDVNCMTCRLCANSKRSCIIGFPSHGSRKYRIDEAMGVRPVAA